MLDDSPPPPLPSHVRDGDERTTLLEMLEYQRAVLLRKAWGLDATQLARTLGPSDLTLGGLLVHMALVEDNWFNYGLLGNEPAEPWASAPWEDDEDWDFHVAAEWTPAEIVGHYQEALATSRAAVAATPSLDAGPARSSPDQPPTTLRWVLVHMIEEYARHCGHADLLRQSIDGLTGD
ncbi:MAG: DinB family protein [Acidimicrobiales bacterium]